MRTIGVLLLAVLVVWVIFNRERIFVRDPIASVYRNNVKQTGIEVYINASNDILLQQGESRTVLQHWDLMPGTPANLTCLRWIACLTAADHAPTLPVDPNGKSTYDPKATMNGRQIIFTDPAGRLIRVQL